MPSTETEIWVGAILQTGAVIVYDPALQLPGYSTFYAYSVNRDLVRKFDRKEIRTKVRAVRGPERDSALLAYFKWKRANAKAFIASEAERLATEERRVAEETARLLDRHREYLAGLGFDASNVHTVPVKPSRRRITHCYGCKQQLDNALHIECRPCGWIICTCGACGCGYAP